MDQPGLEAMFRADELERRSERRAKLRRELRSLYQRMQNEGILIKEVLSPSEQVAHLQAVTRIQEQDALYKKMRYRSYWRRLWRALRGL